MADINGNGKYSTLLRVAINGGMVTITLACLFMIWNLVANHINHNTQVLTKLNASIEVLNTSIDDNTEVLEDVKGLIISK